MSAWTTVERRRQAGRRRFVADERDMKREFDIVIAGGGLVGASLGCALSATPLRVAVIESRPYGHGAPTSYDERTLALAYGSRRILDGLGLWDAVAPDAEPIRTIHVSHRGRLGVARLHAVEEGVEALGYVVASRVLGRALFKRLENNPSVEVIAPATVDALAIRGDRAEVSLTSDATEVTGTLSARMVVAADGRDSMVRRLAGIAAEEVDYGQTAVIANITAGRPHRGVAYERFTETGPLALLPMRGGRCSLVWTHDPETARQVMDWSDDEFLRGVQQGFGTRLGYFQKVGARTAYPLSLVRAQRVVSARVALLGNAAHSLHPVAGQGFNLSLRDVASLTRLLIAAVRAGSDPGGAALLKRYAQWRRWDIERTVRFTDLLARVFTLPWPLLGHVRALGLMTVDRVPTLRHTLARHSMGLPAGWVNPGSDSP